MRSSGLGQCPVVRTPARNQHSGLPLRRHEEYSGTHRWRSSPRMLYASLTFWNFSLAFGSSVRSGWYCLLSYQAWPGKRAQCARRLRKLTL